MILREGFFPLDVGFPSSVVFDGVVGPDSDSDEDGGVSFGGSGDKESSDSFGNDDTNFVSVESGFSNNSFRIASTCDNFGFRIQMGSFPS